MDPTMPMPGQATPQAPQGPSPQAAMQNAMILQAIKSGAMGGGAPPAAQTGAAMGPPGAMGGGMPTPPPTPPVSPNSMPGGLGAQAGAQQMAMPQPNPNAALAAQGAPNPVANALMSPIPGGY